MRTAAYTEDVASDHRRRQNVLFEDSDACACVLELRQRKWNEKFMWS